MTRYVATIPCSMTPDATFLYMSDLRNFAEWDKGVKNVVQIIGSGGGKETVFDVTTGGSRTRHHAAVSHRRARCTAQYFGKGP